VDGGHELGPSIKGMRGIVTIEPDDVRRETLSWCITACLDGFGATGSGLIFSAL
jgi:hypothetical protein